MKTVEGISTVSAPEHLVTYEAEVKDHIITEDQLNLIARGGKDKSFEIAITAAAAAVGFLQNFWTAVQQTINGTAVSLGTLFASVVFIAATTTTIISALYCHYNKTDVDDLIARIKARKTGRMPTGDASLASEENRAEAS